MKDLVGSVGRFLQVTCATAAFMLLSFHAQAQNSLSNYNSTVNLSLGPGGSGMNNWTVSGVNQLAQQWFWYRVGNTAESPINMISAPYINQTIPKLLTVTYSNQSYAVQISYNLTGNSTPGSGYSGITESVKISNFTQAALDFHFFEYADVRLGNTPGGTVAISSQSASTQVIQNRNGLLFNASVSPFAASRFQAANDGSILASLNDAAATTLNDTANATGNVNWALQWDFSVAANNSVQLSHLMTVPEPGSLTLLALGAVGVLWRRRG